jgi:hypothetical protein
MRKKMTDHQVRRDCVQCHQLMDPIGFALENFDGIGLWRSQDEGEAIDASGTMFDNTKVDGPAALREWLTDNYSRQFVTVASEKLLTYALGRGVGITGGEPRDMPLVRTVARDAMKNNARFSALVLSVVKSRPFQMNQRMEPAPAARTARATTEHTGAK